MKGIIKEAQSAITSNLTEISEDLVVQVKIELEKIEGFEFNIFDLDRLLGKKCLYYVMNFIMNKFNFIQDLLVEKNYINFVNEIINGYDRKIPYHNDLHATDVLQTTYILLTKGNFTEVK